MIACFRYQLVSVLLSQRYLPPTLVFLAALAVGTASESGPLQASYAFCVLAMLVCSCWLTVAVVNQEEPSQRDITVVTVGGLLRVLVVTVAVVLTWCVPLLLMGLAYPIVTGSHQVSVGALAVGLVAQVGAATVGTAIGLLCSRLVVPRIGVATLLAAAAVLLAVLVRWSSPVRPLMTLLSTDRTAAAMAGPLAVLTGWGVVLLAASVLVTRLVVDRRA